MLHISESATRFSPVEVWESRNPWVVEKMELATDSCGPGQYRGGPGIDFHFRMLEDTFVTTAVERTKNAPWGLEGGGSGRPNGAAVINGEVVEEKPKATRLAARKGGLIRLETGGGGGYGDPKKRPVEAVRKDLLEGYISEDFARRHYPQAF
jgi:N-methylhydantoinase B